LMNWTAMTGGIDRQGQDATARWLSLLHWCWHLQ
jgi:hypothetical protein